MIISGSVVAHKVLVESVEVDDNISCQLPSLDIQTSEIKGAGILGSIDLPSTGQVGSMTFSMSQRAFNKKTAHLAKPGIVNIELRFVKDVRTSTGQIIPEGTKIFISGINKKLDSGKIESQSAMDGALEYEVLRYRVVIDGSEVLLIDKLNYIFKINGIDYMQNIRAVLG